VKSAGRAPGSDRPLKVLHVVAPSRTGGLEAVVSALMAGQVEAGLDAHVAVVLDAGVEENTFLATVRRTAAGVYPWLLPPRAYRRERSLMAALCTTIEPDVVHTHGYRPDVVDAPVARRLGIATVTTVHGFTFGGWKNRAYQLLQQRAHRRFDAVVAVSRPLADLLARKGILPERLRCEPNAWGGGAPPLDRAVARRALGLPADRFTAGFVGHLAAVKGPDLFLEACARVAGPAVRASVIGAGPMMEGLEARAAALGVADRVTWHGVLEGMGRHMRALDVLVLSSRSEGTPIVLFEAMAAGTPIVATRVGGVPDVVGPGEALLVEPDADQIAGAIRTVFDAPEAAARRAEQARSRLERCFAREPWIRRYESIYRAAIRVRSGQSRTHDPARGA
jgi:glycosyltransferase involved in cell wall biosynthesis